ncbi:MAG TPA: hypothetical protein DEA44_16865 [Firmicutes bacterium]|nr:hypothetical protein [Bacillota bacterium]
MKFNQSDLLMLIAEQAEKILSLESEMKEVQKSADSWKSLWYDAYHQEAAALQAEVEKVKDGGEDAE